MTTDYDFGQWTTPEARQEIEQERQQQAPPPPAPTPTPQPGQPEVLAPTTGQDKYIVKDNGIQKIMTGKEIESKGGKIPDPIKTISEITQAVRGGERYESAYERITASKAAQKMGMSKEELLKDIEGDSEEDKLKNFAKKYGLSIKSAKELIIDFKHNPDNPQYKRLNDWVKRDLERLYTSKETLESSSTAYAWGKLNEASKKNPLVFQTKWINGRQTNILTIEEAVKSGMDDPEVFNLIGDALSKRSDMPVLVKTSADDRGTYYAHGWSGITKNQLLAINNAREEREELNTLLNSKGVTRDDSAEVLIKAGIDDKKTLQKLGYNITEKDIKDTKAFIKYIEDKDTPEELKEAYRKGGITGYNRAVIAYNLKVEADNAKSQAEYGEYLQYKARYDAAMAKLKEYQAANGGIYVESFFRDGGNIETLEAVGIDFDKLPENVKNSYSFYQSVNRNASNYKEREKLLSKVQESGAIVPLPPLPIITDKGTPALKYGPPLETDYVKEARERLSKAGVPKEAQNVILAGLGVTVASPVPGDESAAALLIIGTAGAFMAGKVIGDFINRNKKAPTVQNIVAVNNQTGQIMPLSGVTIDVPKEGWIPQLIAPQMKQRITAENIPPMIKSNYGTELTPPELKHQIEQVIGKGNTVVILDDPAIRPEEIGISGAIMEYQAAKKTVVDTIPIDYNKILREAKQKDTDKAFERINEAIRGGTAIPINKDLKKEYELYRTAYAEYLRKKAILAEAWKSYVNSVNPTPVNGSLDKTALQTLAAYQLQSKVSGKNKRKAIRLLKQYFENSPDARTTNKALTKTLTETKRALAIEEARDTATATQTATQTATKAATHTLTSTAVSTMEADNTKARDLTRENEAVNERTLTKERFRLMPGATDKEKREFIANSDMAVTYRRGELQDDVWHTWAMNKGQLTRIITQGNAPEGAQVVDGPGSASKTLKKFGRGALPRTIYEDTGAIDTVISPSGGDVKIGFKQDRITPKMPRLSQRAVRISPRMPRLSPKMPRLR